MNYAPEEILEAYYSIAVLKQFFVTLDWQYIRDPGYNADRGPAQVASVRLHAEF